MKKLIFLLILTAIFLGSCADYTLKLGEKFTLYQDETAKIEGEPISVTLRGVGREWTEEDEYAMVDLEIKYNGETTLAQIDVGDVWKVDEYDIELISANPFGDVNCSLVITKP